MEDSGYYAVFIDSSSWHFLSQDQSPHKVNLEPTAEEAAELLAAAVMGLNDPEVRRSNVGPGVSTQFPRFSQQTPPK